MSFFKIKGLRSGYGKSIVIDGIDLNIGKGECVSIIGPNGAGKTTLLNTISGFLNYSGEIIFENRSLGGMKPYEISRSGIAHCPEGRHILKDYDIFGNLTAGIKNIRDSRNLLNFCFSIFPVLEERVHQKASKLSGGEQQMLAIARALMTSPKLLMLDEPSMGLAPIVKKQLFYAIKMITARVEASILIVEQDASMIMPISGKLLILEHGKIIFEGLPADLQKNNGLKNAYLGVE